MAIDLPPYLDPPTIEIVEARATSQEFQLAGLFSRTINVGPDRRNKSLARAINNAPGGSTILVDPGTYVDEFATIQVPLTIKANGGEVRLVPTQSVPNGKGIFITRANATFDGITFVDAKVRDRNGAGIRYEKGDLTVINCTFENNQNGIMGGRSDQSVITVLNSTFRNNGGGDGYTHGIYIGLVKQLTVRDSHFTGTRAGHHIKTRAATSIIEHNYLDDAEGNPSYSIDMPNGGHNVVTRNVIIQTEQPDNPALISFGTKKSHQQNDLLLEDNWLINHYSSGTGINNPKDLEVVLKDNRFYNLRKHVAGPAEVTGSTTLEKAPNEEDLFQTWRSEITPLPAETEIQ